MTLVAEVTNDGATIRTQWGFPPEIRALPPEARRSLGWYGAVEAGKDPERDPLAYETVESGRAVTGDVVTLTYEIRPRDLAAVRAEATARINREAAERYGRYDAALLRVIRTGEALWPEIRAALDAIAVTASAARVAVTQAETVDEVAGAFPLSWPE